METLSNNLIATAIVSITIAMLVIPAALANHQRLTLRDRLINNALGSFSNTGGKRRRYTPEEDALILSRVIKDSDIELVIQRTKNSIQVRRNSLKNSKA